MPVQRCYFYLEKRFKGLDSIRLDLLAKYVLEIAGWLGQGRDINKGQDIINAYSTLMGVTNHALFFQ